MELGTNFYDFIIGCISGLVFMPTVRNVRATVDNVRETLRLRRERTGTGSENYAMQERYSRLYGGPEFNMPMVDADVLRRAVENSRDRIIG